MLRVGVIVGVLIVARVAHAEPCAHDVARSVTVDEWRDDEPAVGAIVEAARDGFARQVARADRDGIATLHLAPGRWRVCAWLRGDARSWGEIELYRCDAQLRVQSNELSPTAWSGFLLSDRDSRDLLGLVAVADLGAVTTTIAGARRMAGALPVPVAFLSDASYVWPAVPQGGSSGTDGRQDLQLRAGSRGWQGAAFEGFGSAVDARVARYTADGITTGPIARDHAWWSAGASTRRAADGDHYGALATSTVAREFEPGPRSPRSLDRRLAAVIDALDDLAPAQVIELRGCDEATVRRWCWIRCWVLDRNAEDIFLMDPPCRPWLLDEAAADCPKREVAIALVAHSVRDAAHAALVHDFRAFVRDLDGLAAIARRADAPDLVDYLGRLARSAQPGRVDEAEARSRIHDLTRCQPPDTVEVTRRGDRWFARDSPLVIDARTGAMSLDRT